jgi:hypothetical protein
VCGNNLNGCYVVVEQDDEHKKRERERKREERK